MKKRILLIALVSLFSCNQAFAWGFIGKGIADFFDWGASKKLTTLEYEGGLLSGKNSIFDEESLRKVQVKTDRDLRKLAKAHNDLIEEITLQFGDVDISCPECSRLYGKLSDPDLVTLGSGAILASVSLTLLNRYERELSYEDVVNQQKIKIINSLSKEERNDLETIFQEHFRGRSFDPKYRQTMLRLLKSCPSDIKESIRKDQVFPKRGC